MIVTVPAPTAVKTPCELIVATVLSELSQGVLDAGLTFALS